MIHALYANLIGESIILLLPRRPSLPLCGFLPSFILVFLFLDTSVCVINYLGRGINIGFEVDQRNLHGRLMIMITYCLPRSDYDGVYVYTCACICIISNRSHSFISENNRNKPPPFRPHLSVRGVQVFAGFFWYVNFYVFRRGSAVLLATAENFRYQWTLFSFYYR